MSAVELSSVASSAGEPQGTLSALRRAVADIAAAPRGEMRGETRLALGLAPLDRALDGGLDEVLVHIATHALPSPAVTPPVTRNLHSGTSMGKCGLTACG